MTSKRGNNVANISSLVLWLYTVKKPRVINAFLSFRNAFLNQKREREHFEVFQTRL